MLVSISCSQCVHVCVCLWLELLTLTVVQNSTCLWFYYRGSQVVMSYLFLIPFWTIWEWGLAGKNGCHRRRGVQFTDSWQGHFYEMPDELLPQGMAWTLVSGSSITCVQGFLCPQFFPAPMETVPLIWCWDLQHKQDWVKGPLRIQTWGMAI